ncbi:MAG: hypothetical protein FWG67_00085 [Defluviitaleaceae bacterium]|nr:hypothetical protein [Defluviitaleaceae bacterium]
MKVLSWILYYIVTLITVIVLGILFPIIFLVEFIGGGLLFIFWIVIPVSISIINHIKEEREATALFQWSIPENVGEKSYIDKQTSFIYLRPDNYEMSDGEEWVIDDESISIRLNRDYSVRKIEFSEIKSVNLNADLFSFSFSILEERPYDPLGDGSVVEYKPELVMHGPIYVEPDEFHIMKTAYNRVFKKSSLS